MATVRQKTNSDPILKELYNVNQLIKHNAYSYNAEYNIFTSITENNNPMIISSEIFGKFNLPSFSIEDGSALYSFLKECKNEGNFNLSTSEITGSNDKVFATNPYKDLFNVEEFFVEEVVKKLSSKQLSLYNENNLVKKNDVHFDDIQDLNKLNKKLAGHYFLYLEIDKNNLIVRNSKTNINIDNEFFILDGNEFIKLKSTKTDKKEFNIDFINSRNCLLSYSTTNYNVHYKLEGIFKINEGK